jgi:cyclic nucleotide gated channel
LDESLQIVGAFWYLLAVERNDACWQEACSGIGTGTGIKACKSSLYCRNQAGVNNDWQKVLSSNCTANDSNKPFDFGIYAKALISSPNTVTVYGGDYRI